MSGDEIECFCAVPGAALLVVAAALIDPDGQVMLQQRPAGRHHGGLWEYPGGKVEPGEGPVAALVRELREELAIEIMPGDCVPLGFSASESGLAAGKSGGAVVLLLYACRIWRGEAVSQEGAAIAWCMPDTLHIHAMPPLDIPLARIVTRYVTTAF